MKHKILNLVVIGLMIFGLLVMVMPVSAHSDKGNGNAELSGVIKAVDVAGSSLTVTARKTGADVVLKVDAATQIKRGNHKTATLADLQVGDKVEVKYDTTTMLASRITAKADLVSVKGVISAVNVAGSTLSITPTKGGADVTVLVDSATMIKRANKVATLADLQVGDKVEAKYNRVSMLAVSIVAKLNIVNLNGAITAVDTAAGTITVTPKKAGADVVLNVNADTRIIRNGKLATPADLQVGDKLEVKYNVAGMLALKIEAQNRSKGNFMEVKGTIAAIDPVASTLTITRTVGGPDVVLKVDSTTLITKHHLSATLADLVVGDKVEAKYNPLTMLASKVDVE